MEHRAKDCPTTNKKKDNYTFELEKEVKDALYSILENNKNNSSSDEILAKTIN